MTEPAPSGGPSPLRVGGLALLGAGAVAALIGLATLLPGGGSSTTPAPTTPPPAPSAAPTPGATVAAPPAPTAPVAVPSFSPTGAIAAPPAAPAAPAPANPQAGAGRGGSGGGQAIARGPVRVYNNSTITGLASRAAGEFRADGWQVGQIANYSAGVIPTSTVYYRPGTAEQSAASSMGSAFGLRVEPRFSGIDDATPGLIVIVTNDYQKRK